MKKFVQHEKEWIKENYKSKTLNEMCEYLGRTKGSLKAFAHSIGLKNSFDYSRKNNLQFDDEKLCYILGFIWADGHVNEKGCVDLTILSEDAEIIKPIINYIEGFREKQNNRLNRRPSTSFISRNKELVSMLLKFGFRDKSNNEPTKLLEAMPKKNHYLFWRGVFDGDGCIYNQKTSKTKISKRIEISGRYDYKWIELSKILSDIGCNFSIKRSINVYGKNSVIKIWRKNDIVSFGEYIYQDMGHNGHLPRKKIKFY